MKAISRYILGRRISIACCAFSNVVTLHFATKFYLHAMRTPEPGYEWVSQYAKWWVIGIAAVVVLLWIVAACLVGDEKRDDRE